MTLNDATGAGRELAERHVALTAASDRLSVNRDQSLLNFSEVIYPGDWSLRSALCRLAQPEPLRVGRVLESVRRLEAVLHHAQKSLERHPAWCLRPTAALVELMAAPTESSNSEGQASHCDLRAADIARLIESGLDADAVMAGYSEVDGVEPLTIEEQAALPTLGVAVRFEELSEVMTTWANQGPADRPVDAFDDACDEIEARLDQLGVPKESGPPPRGARSRR